MLGGLNKSSLLGDLGNSTLQENSIYQDPTLTTCRQYVLVHIVLSMETIIPNVKYLKGLANNRHKIT